MTRLGYVFSPFKMNPRIIFKNLSKLNVIHVSHAFKSNEAFRSARFLGKLMHGTRKRSKWYSDEPKATSLNIFSKPKEKTVGRRHEILGHVLMTHIVELMATGQYASEIQEEKISITKVKLHPDFKGLNIYWYKKSGVPNEDTDKFLQKISSYLRQEMCHLQVCGLVPPIYFVKDKTFFYEAEIENLIKIADFPDDYKPLSIPDPIKSDLGYEDVVGKNPNEEEDSLPEMKHNVFGLNRAKIIDRIQNELSKRISIHSDRDIETIQLPKPRDTNIVDFDQKEYATYLRKRKEARALAREDTEYEKPDYVEYEEGDEWENEHEDDDYEYEYEDHDKKEYEDKDDEGK